MATIPTLPEITAVTGDDLLVSHDITTNRSGRVSAAALKTYTNTGLTSNDIAYALGTVGGQLDKSTRIIPNFAALSSTGGFIGDKVYLLGHTVAGIGGGNFIAKASTGLTPDGGTVAINGALAWVRDTTTITPEMFGAIGDGTTNDIVALEAFSSAVSMSIPGRMDGNYRINRTFKIKRGKKISGSGSVIADFTATAPWSGDYCAIDMVVDTADSGAIIFAGFGQYLSGIKITSISASSVQATGIRFRTSLTVAVASVVNFSYLSGTISSLTIEKFDTAFDLRECWSVVFSNIIVYNCRRAVFINGKVVNVTFGSGCRFSNPDTAYTSSTSDTVGFEIDSSTRYTSGAQGRPEGIAITDGVLVYGYDNNIIASRVLALVISDSVIDGAAKDCIVLGSGDDIRITNNYIFSSGAYSGIRVDGVASSYGSKFSIINNHFIGSAPTNTCYGINFVNTGVSRNGVKIVGNTFTDWTIGINAVLCPKYSKISDNFGFTLISDLVYVQNGGDGTEISGNKTEDSINALRLHPVTSSGLIIGDNRSSLNRTHFVGKATILSGTSSISLPNNFRTTGDNYVRAVTKVTFLTPFSGTYYITDEFSLADAKITLSATAPTNIDIRYECIAVPYSAF